ncbi:MAG: glycoside hydrolase family 57 protein [Patescibacteria group bacterium]|nr:glycoside hydrolase family 57 protein [Patescibacteria group bacterium]
MPSIVFYFKIHQPDRLRHYTIFDIENSLDYFDEERNKFYLDRIVHKCYQPTLELIEKLIEETRGKFKVSFGLTGSLIDQFKKWHPEIIIIFQRLAKTGSVEFVGETYHHSLASLYSRKEFKEEVQIHKNTLKRLFNQIPVVFANTELIYFDGLVETVKELGFQAILTEGVPWILEWRSPTFIYHDPSKQLKILLRHYKLSDDISFRFSAKWWEEWPLTADKFASWVEAHNGQGEVINLFMDFETFGEHQWAETGIFQFLESLPFEVLKRKDLEFSLPSEVVKKYPSRGVFSSARPITWADTERDLTAWLGNEMQKECFEILFSLEKDIPPHLKEIWRKLQTADHFYYMCTKWFADGDVHKYFNPYDNPYEAYLNFRNVLEDLKLRAKPNVKVHFRN